jgi:hypothetical protein
MEQVVEKAMVKGGVNRRGNVEKFDPKLSLRIDHALVKLEAAQTERERTRWSKRLARLQAKIPPSPGDPDRTREARRG